MDIEYWWLLALPAFFALGWMAARIDIRHLLSESRVLPASYFKGLNFLHDAPRHPYANVVLERFSQQPHEAVNRRDMNQGVIADVPPNLSGRYLGVGNAGNALTGFFQLFAVHLED